LEDMTDKASALEWIANQNPNSQTAALYRNMSDKIKGIRDDIMMNGFNGNLRTDILNTRKIYSANSAEITRRYNDMVKYRDRMAALQDKDPSMKFSIDSQSIGIDDFAGGNRPKIKAVSGDQIMQRGVAVGKRLTSQIFGDGVLGQEMSGQFWKTYKEQGMDDNALKKALDSVDQKDKFQMVKQIIDSVYKSFDDFSNDDKQYLKNRFIEGVYDGSVYVRNVDYQANEDHMNPYENAQIKWGNDQNDRANAEEFRNNLDWEFANGRSIRYIWTTDENGKRVKRGLAYDPYTGKQSLIDLETGGVIKSSDPPQQKKKEEKPKQPNIKPMAVYRNGKTATVPKNGGTIINTGSEEYLTAVSTILKQYPDVTPEQVLMYCNVYTTGGSDNNTVYYALPKTNKPEPEASSGGDNGGGEEDTVTE